MEWTKLAKRIADDSLPLVLAGPIVRRVTAESAAVWVATRFPCTVTLQLFRGSTSIGTGTPTPTVPIGTQLHMVVVTAPIPVGTRDDIRYDIDFQSSGGGPSGQLFSPRIIASTATDARRILTYDPEPFTTAPTGPSFRTPPSVVDEIRILHGSCRKIAGDGKDGFPAIDEIMKQHFSPPVPGTPPKRPTMLVLTGDNIYTDGSEEVVLKVSTEIGETLLGFDEHLPGLNKPVSQIEGGRSALTLETVGMTGARPWRAIGFGEVLALYLMTFADVVWPPELAIDSEGFRAGMATTRRILANIPTYMTFDDHEIGNSWNICYDWYSTVLTKPLGRRVYQNCMAAFALCQAWGNTPDQFTTPGKPGTAFLAALATWTVNKAVDVHPRELEIRLGIPRQGTPAPHRLAELHTPAGAPDDPFHLAEPQIRWDFSVPCGSLELVVLDVHTWTEYSETDGFEPGRRMPVVAWDAQLPAPVAGSPVAVAVIVVSNVAIVDARTANAVRQQLIEGGGAFGAIIHGLFTLGLASFAAFFAVSLLGDLALIAILLYIAFKLTTTLIGLFRDGVFPNFPYVLPALRSSRNVYLPETGYNFEWTTPPFERLLARLADHYRGTPNAKVVVLSGDVHESYTMRLEYFGFEPFSFPAPAGPRQVRSRAVFAQLVSSPIKYTATKEPPEDSKRDWFFAAWTGAKPRVESNTVDPSLPTSDHLVWWNKDPWIAAFTPVGQGTAILKSDNTDPAWLYQITAVDPDALPATVTTVTPPAGITSTIAALKQLSDARIEAFLNKQHTVANGVGDVGFTPGGASVMHDVWRWWKPVNAVARWQPIRFVVQLVSTLANPWQVPHA